VQSATIEQYHPEIAAGVAELIHAAFRSYEGLRLNLTSTPLWEMKPETLAERLTDEAISLDASFVAMLISLDASFVAMLAGRPVSAVIARTEGEATSWWCIATDPGFQRRGLASACLGAAEDALRASGAETAKPTEVVDSRWRSACGFLERAGYVVEQPEQDSITMQLDMNSWLPREVRVAPGYEIVSIGEEDLEGWTACRNQVFNTDVPVQWFRDHFMSRHDFDFAGWHAAKREGRVVGIAGAQIIRDEREPDTVLGCMIEYVAVMQEHRRQGLAEALVVACLNHAKALNAQPLMLITQPFRVPAVRLYEKLGFKEIAEQRRYVKPL